MNIIEIQRYQQLKCITQPYSFLTSCKILISEFHLPLVVCSDPTWCAWTYCVQNLSQKNIFNWADHAAMLCSTVTYTLTSTLATSGWTG